MMYLSNIFTKAVSGVNGSLKEQLKTWETKDGLSKEEIFVKL